MLNNEDIICISSIDWDFVWQGHQEIMSAYAKSGNRVLFIENTGIRAPTIRDLPRLKKRVANWLKSVKGFRKESENLYVYSPIILPFPYSRAARWINRIFMLGALKRWMDVMSFRAPIVWTFLPTETAMDIIHGVNRKALIYYYIADFEQLSRNKRLREVEERLMKECDVIFVQGEHFKKRCLGFNKNVYVFPFGVNVEAFKDFINRRGTIKQDPAKGIKRPIIGYVGGIHRHVDFGLLRAIALKRPEWSIVMVGPLQTSVQQLSDMKNIYFIGKKDFSEMLLYLDVFDVAIVPYLLSEYTNTVYPTKINEYHMLGKPVVSTPLPEVIKSNDEALVLIAKNQEEFVDRIESALRSAGDKALAGRRVRHAMKNSWSARIEDMSRQIEESLDKKHRFPVRWQEKFVGMYKRSRLKAMKLIAISAVFFGVVFYTPLIWYLARPLEISQKPQISDAILVFGGGVGEGGKAGQGYEERVGYAVELYVKGYSKNLVFSSGIRSTFPEPYIMKALAVSLGVSEKAIILEDKAKSTYENVKFTDEILNKQNWKNIILVSSPYHMKRASLVFSKMAPDIKVVYSPVSKSQFYRHGGIDKRGKKIWAQINVRQIKAILHEYLAIIYYWLKGWI